MVKKNLGLRERKKLQTRKKILKYSTRLFEKHGYDNTAIGDICDRCEISKATFFNYFETKEQLLLDILSDDLEDMLDKIDEQGKEKDLDIKELIYIICKKAIESITKYPYVSRLVYSKLLVDVEGHYMHNRFKTVMLESITSSQVKGIIDNSIDPVDVYASFEGLILGMLVANSSVDKDTKVADGMKIILRGLDYKG